MVRPYLRGRRRYILVHWPEDRELDKGALIGLVKRELRPATAELGPPPGRVAKRIAPAVARFEPPWAAIVVDHELAADARGLLNTCWRGVELTTKATSGTLKALWRRTGQ